MPKQPPAGERLSVVISTCCRRDLHTWAAVAPRLRRYVEADGYRLVVPDDDVAAFRRVTPPRIDVVGEGDYAVRIHPLLAARGVAESPRRAWYLQQFIKLLALEAVPDDALALVWDADTMPLRPLRFHDSLGRVVYRRGTEHHQPYFECIGRLLGLPKIAEASFIAQCFPIRGLWFREFREAVERRHGRPWLEAIVACIDFAEPSGFSEYETLGTFLAVARADDIAFTPGRWLRDASGRAGRAGNVAWAWPVLAGYEYASFEHFHRPFAALTWRLGRLRSLIPRGLVGLTARLRGG